MTAILSMLAVLASAAWYYRTAARLGLPALAWAVAGVLVYYGGFLFWMHVVLRPLMGGQFQAHGFGVGIAMDLSSILFGAAGVALFGFKVLMKKGRESTQIPS